MAKLRAARRLWHSDRHRAVRARRDPASARLRFFSGNSGTTLTAQQPLNNIVRSTIQCLGAVLGGAQSIHVMGYDEAYEIPSEEAVTLSLRTQQIIALETGVTRTADPLAGSYYVEWLTDEIGARAREVMDDVEQAGGAVAALEAGVPQRWIAESAYRIEREISSGLGRRWASTCTRTRETTPSSGCSSSTPASRAPDPAARGAQSRAGRGQGRRSPARSGRRRPRRPQRDACPDRGVAVRVQRSARCRTCCAASSASSRSRACGDQASRGTRVVDLTRFVAGS